MSVAPVDKAITVTSLSDTALPCDRRGLLGDIYQSYWPELCRYINKTFGAGPPDPEDVAQQAFTNFAALDDPHAIVNPRAFLYRSAHNIAIHQIQRQATRDRFLLDAQHAGREEKADDADAESVLIARQRLGIVERAIRLLPHKQRRLLLLHRIHKLSYAEISRRTGMSRTQVKRHIAKAIAGCRQALRDAERQRTLLDRRL